MITPSRNDSGLVYSTGAGRICSACGSPAQQCTCKDARAAAVPQGDGIVRVGRETKGRKGGGVTVITGILRTSEELRDLARDLKQRCGSGGTVKNGVIELQGEQRTVAAERLRELGFTVKRSGG